MTDPAFPEALPGLSRLHWYVIERVLGQGGFGITYLATDANLDQKVAIKEYLPVDVATRMPDATIRSRTDDLRDRYRWGLDRFIQEARTLARFDHPNIVRVQSVFEFNNTAYMVMRFEQGLTLSALLDRRGTLPERDLLRVVIPILDGLELVHNAGFIHRDIKPDNIHIGDDGDPVLLDFGSARQALGSSRTLTILVAPGYAPFEQYYSDSSSQGPWTDIYALGATCYRAIAGRPPLDAVSRSKGILGSSEEMLVPASVIGAGRYSPAFLSAIDHALAFAEKDRPQSIAEWRRELVAESTQPPPVTVLAAAQRSPAQSAATISAPVADPATTLPPFQGVPDQATSQSESAGELQAIEQPRRSKSQRRTIATAIIGAILATGVAVYMQIQDNERAASERQRQGEEQARKKEADEQARKKEADDQAAKQKADEEKVAGDLAPGRETEGRRHGDDKKGGKATPKTPTPNPSPPTQPPRQDPPAAIPAPSQASSAPDAAPQSAAPVPEAPKPSPTRTPADQVADADHLLESKNYADAIKILRPLANAGYPPAQFRLGNTYAAGDGVAQDYTVAADWYEKAALKGDVNAMLKLGSMYASGTGVPMNNNLAYVYYGAAARRGSEPAKSARDKLAPSLQPAEQNQFEKLIDKKFGPAAK